MGTIRVAGLLTCYNRREATGDCIKAVLSQKDISGIDVKVYLLDDASTDGTGEAVRNRFPHVKLLKGNGNLYWCGGMRMAWSEAMKKDYDYYLWLNDDTRIYENTLRDMIDTAEAIRKTDGRDGIVVGSTRDPDTGKQTYGGVRRIGKTLGFDLIEPQDKPLRCDTMNGNCVLVPKAVARVTGNLSGKFTHAIADTDYGLRAGKDGFSCWVTPGYIGECRRNPPPEWTNPEIPLYKRLKNLRDPKGLPPGQWTEFARRHAGKRWPEYALKLWLRVLFPRFWKWRGK
jgi:GT2 family glycosyltransferase